MIELIIAVLSMLAIGPFAASLATMDASPETSRSVAAIDTTVLAPALYNVATQGAEASRTATVDRPVPKEKVVLPVYTRVASENKLERYVSLAANRLDPRMQDAMEHIPDNARRVLALKYYSRRRGGIDGRWALSTNQIERHSASKAHQKAVATVEAIKLRFAEQNPGYRLNVITDVRSLEKQIEIWNTLPSTAEAGESLVKKAEKALVNSKAWPDEPSPNDVARFQRFVASASVSRSPTAAVPGLSLHGTGRAFDFIIWKGDEIVAGAVAETTREVWDKAGWTKKLKDAITAVSDRFDGPLRAPYEPWHYNYRP